MITESYGSDTHQKCDIYSAPNTPIRDNAVVVMVIHGGAWIFGKRGEMKEICSYLVEQTQTICVAPDYCLSQVDVNDLQKALLMELMILLGLCGIVNNTKARFLFLFLSLFLTILTCFIMTCSETHLQRYSHPKHVQDIAECITFVQKRLRTNNIFLLGHSAGAHLAALVTLNKRFLTSLHTFSNCIKGVIGISGPYSFWRMQESSVRHILNRTAFNLTGIKTNEFSEKQLLALCNTNFQDIQNQKDFDRWNYIVDAWPMFHDHQITKDTPPFLLLTSGVDLSLLHHTKDFALMLQKAGVHVQHVHFRDTNHFSIRKEWLHKNKHVGETVRDFINLCKIY